MDEKELIEALRGEEWNDIEFKEASREVPKSAYKTVSSFSNTRGGTIIFGVKKNGSEYIPSGVIAFDKVQNDFLSALKGGMKLNHQIDVTEDMKVIGEKRILIFHIPEADRVKKPIYLNGDIRQSHVRRGGCDHRCTPEEIHRFLRDSSTDRWDGITVDLPLKGSFDHDSVSWYRKRFEDNNPGHSNGDDIDFLYEWGFLIRKDDILLPTRASIIVFGSRSALHQILTKPSLDMQWIPAGIKDEQPEMRWYDRIVLEENLINTWREAVRKFIQYSPKPFRIDPHTMMRDGTPPDYRVFRELAVNLLVHQDFGDQGRKGVIKFFKDGILFWNPGDVFGRYDDLLEPGEKDVRNPRIVDAFRRIALCERAGTGLRMVMEKWKEIGNPRPSYNDNKEDKSFEIVLPYKSTVQIPLDHYTREIQMDGNWEIEKASSGDQVGADKGPSRDQVGVDEAPSRHQVGVDGAFEWREGGEKRASGQREVSVEGPNDTEILRFCIEYRSLKDIMTYFSVSDRTKFRRNHMDPLLDKGQLEKRFPDSPTAPNQKYRTTSKGIMIIDGMN